jgi:hypothetical protein
MVNEDFHFNIVYDGEALKEGSIDVRDLAPALLAFADIVDYGGKVVDSAAPAITVRVRADFKKGSFDVGLELAQAYDKFVTLFSGSHVQAWATLFSLVGISGAGLLQLLKRSKGKKPKVIEIERSEKVRILFDGEEPQDIDKRIWWMFNHPSIRKAIEKVIDPLSREGIDKFEIRRNKETMLEVNKADAPYFKAPVQNDNEKTSENPNAMLVILSPSFREGNKWRVHDGRGEIWVAIEDEAFRASVQRGSEAFRKGDLLHVTLQTRQWMEGNELKAEHTIIRVHKHENRLDHPALPGTE